jgi:hypothetical protein
MDPIVITNLSSPSIKPRADDEVASAALGAVVVGGGTLVRAGVPLPLSEDVSATWVLEKDKVSEEVDDGVTWEFKDVPVGEVLGVIVVTTRPFPIVLAVTQSELAGAGCAEGVMGSP